MSFETINYRLHVWTFLYWSKKDVRDIGHWIWVKTESATSEGIYAEMLRWELERYIDQDMHLAITAGYAISKCRAWRSPLPERTRLYRYQLDSVSVEIPFYRNASPDQLHLLRREIEEIEHRMTW